MQKPLLSPDAFVGLDGVTHLCTGGEAPWLRAQADVYQDFARLKSGGEEGRREIYRIGESCRVKMGRLWDVGSDRVAFTPSASEGMSWLARGLDWRQGDNVVTTSIEFPSVAYAWRNLKSRGVDIRFVPHRDWVVAEEDLVAAVDDRTRVLAVSQVSFYTGQCLDIEALASGLRRVGTIGREVLLAVDATHASGVVRVPAGVTDLCVSSSYKWMLATHGVAPCYLSPRAEERVGDSSFGWHNLAVWPAQGAERLPEAPVKSMPERLEPGNPAMVVVMFLDRAMQVILDIGLEAIQEHALDLSELVTTGLDRLGMTVISPRQRRARSGNTCFLADDARACQQALKERGVLVWGEHGRVRVSGHLYNGSDDVDCLIEALKTHL
jgi:selenocysteine lyase/cysteine desulfurase